MNSFKFHAVEKFRYRNFGLAMLAGFFLASLGCAEQTISAQATENQPQENTTTTGEDPQQGAADKQSAGQKKVKMEKATFGAGCFWCVEAVFQELEGVHLVQSAYMGGHTDNPTYKQVCTGTTGHAEVVHLEYDPSVVSFDTLLAVFWKTHDPTTLNQQGADRGTQYRSAVFFHNDEQKEKAELYKKKLNEEKAFRSPVVTEITAASKLYVAEDYHQDYFKNNPNQGYCRALIPPKLEKMRKIFGDKLKKK